MGKGGWKKGRPKPTPQLKQYQFKPGQSGNPSGKPVMPPEMRVKARVLRELTQKSFMECVELVCAGNLAALEAMAKDENVSALQVGVAASMARALREGDYDTITKIVQTVTGKPPERLIIDSNNRNLNATVEVPGPIDPEVIRSEILKLEGEV